MKLAAYDEQSLSSQSTMNNIINVTFLFNP